MDSIAMCSLESSRAQPKGYSIFRRTYNRAAYLGRLVGQEDIPESMSLVAIEAIEQVRAGYPNTAIEVWPHCYLKASDVVAGLRLQDFVQPTLSVAWCAPGRRFAADHLIDPRTSWRQ